MSKKKLLSEAQVRRFMGLAGIQPLNEMGDHNKDLYQEEEEELDIEAEEEAELPVPEEEVEAELEVSDEAPEEETEMDADSLLGIKDKLESVLNELEPLFAAASEEEGEGLEGEEELGGEEIVDDESDVEMDVDADMADEEDEDELLEDVQLQLTETEIVNEVARRVAKRIVEAKKAHNKMNEALGRPAAKRRRKK